MFKQAIYSIALRSFAILLHNHTENGIFLVVRICPAAQLRQSKKSTAPYHTALGYSQYPGG